MNNDKTFEMLMEDLSDAYSEYVFSALLEDVSAPDPDEEVKKDNIFKRFWNTVVTIFKFIGTKIKEFCTKIWKYIKTFKTDMIVLNKDYTVSHEVMTGTNFVTTKLVVEMSKLLGKAEVNNENEYEIEKCRDSINQLFESKKYTFKKGTPVKVNIIERNIMSTSKDCDKASKDIEKYSKKLENTNNENRSKIMTIVIESLNRYKTYLVRIMNETASFLQKINKDNQNQ